MNQWIRVLSAVGVIAIVAVLFSEYRKNKQGDAWNRLGDALAQENQIEALEVAREASDGMEAEPWIAYDLTIALYDKGGPDNLQRAAQVAQATLKEYPDHPVGALLAELVPALESYTPAAAATAPASPN